MSAPTTQTPQGQLVSAFVGQVRRHLDDLPSDDVEELVGGLEADLADSLAEAAAGGTDDPARLLGDPAVYAAELRAGAGLPPRGADRGPRRPRPWRTLERAFRSAGNRVTSAPWWPSVRDFCAVLQPVWWVLRGWIVARLILGFFKAGDSGLLRAGLGGLLLVLACVVLSVQLGRRRWGRVAPPRWLVVAGNILAVVVLPVLLADLHSPDLSLPGYTGPSDGMWVHGEPVQNVFPYDSQGQPLTGVQLFDQKGRPILAQTGASAAAARDPYGAARWNVYPLWLQGDPTYVPNGEERPGPVYLPKPALGAVPPVTLPSASPTPSAQASTGGGAASPSPTASAGASPSGTSTATATPTASASASPRVSASSPPAGAPAASAPARPAP